jgi:hypothetical protein
MQRLPSIPFVITVDAIDLIDFLFHAAKIRN